MKRVGLLSCLALPCLLVFWPRWSLAQSATSAKDEAAERFDRALRQVNAGDLSGGLAEFERAYALVPSAVVVYNLGLVYAALHRPVEASRALTKALAQSGALTPDNVERARRLLVEQQQLIGSVDLVANVKEGVVEIDNIAVAKWPLSGPLQVSGGPHVIGVIAPGFAPARREVMVAGRETVRVALELVAIEGLLAHLAVRCRVPAADVFVDGERIGRTPLEATISVTPGTHQVEVRRVGYATASRSLSLQGGSRAELSLTPAIDDAALRLEGGYLSVRPSETQAVVSVDGEEASLVGAPIRLPRGAHRVHLERGGFLAAERDVDVARGRTTALSVTFEPTPETRADYVASAEKRRTWSLIGLGAGLAVAGGGTALALIQQQKLPGARRDLSSIELASQPKKGGNCDPTVEHDLDNGMLDPSHTPAACAGLLADAQQRVDNMRLRRSVGWVTAGIGVAGATLGTILLIAGDDPHKYDKNPIKSGLLLSELLPSVGTDGFSVTAIGTF